MAEKVYDHEIIGESPAILKILETIRKVATSSTLTTLISGESGTGKEVFARLLHNWSHFAEQPFVDINCGAIPETLLESELFGYEKGAFTGAYKRKQGLFELASGGTIFLDEIGETSLNFQVKLLKVVENKRFRRIGGVEDLNVSTRIIAATNVNLPRAVEQQKFRADLYYRLSVYQIELPPLRKRGDDVLLLAQHFIDQYNHEYGREVKGLAPSAIELVRKFPWPGNVRQLKNAIERAVLVESEEWIEDGDLSLDMSPRTQRQKVDVASALPKSLNQKLSFNKFDIPPEGVHFEQVKRDLILSAIEKSRGNLSQAARLLHINRGKLRYQLEKMGVTPQDLLSFKLESW